MNYLNLFISNREYPILGEGFTFFRKIKGGVKLFFGKNVGRVNLSINIVPFLRCLASYIL